MAPRSLDYYRGRAPGVIEMRSAIIIVIIVMGVLVSDSAWGAPNTRLNPCGSEKGYEKFGIKFGIKCLDRGGGGGGGSGGNENPVERRTSRREELNRHNQIVARQRDCANMRAGGKQGTAKYRRLCVAPKRVNIRDVIQEEFKRLPLPKGTVVFQPSWGALVNKKEIFYTRTPRDHRYPITLLGQHVVVTTHVKTYGWTWGDGASEQTDGPGGPYPNFTVSHTYARPQTCNVTLSLTYTATYSVNGGPEQPIAGTVTITGNPIRVRVVPAHAVLVQGGH